MSTGVTYDLVTQDGKTFHTHRKHLIPCYPNETLLFPHIRSYKEQNSETFQDSDKWDLIQKDLYTSYDITEFDDNVFYDDPFCNNDHDQSITFDKELYKSGKLNDKHYTLWR